jgi:hypothetical protein
VIRRELEKRAEVSSAAGASGAGERPGGKLKNDNQQQIKPETITKKRR